MPTIAQNEESLFQEWAIRCGPEMARDGVVDESAYLASQPKLLFLLKEVNDPGPNFDLRSFLREGGRPQTWNNVTRWVRAIRALPSEISWSDLQDVGEVDRKAALRAIAAANLKKDPGIHTTKRYELRQAALRDGDLIRRQLALYHADYTICCGEDVGYLMQEIVGFSLDDWQAVDGSWVTYLRHPHFGTIISFWHPQARTSWTQMLNDLTRAVRHVT